MIEIRTITEKDSMKDVSDIYEQSWKHAYRGIIPDTWLARIPSGQWANGLKQSNRFSLVLFDDGKMCGAASYSHARMESMKDYGEIISIYLLPEVMRMGYGYQLMRAAISELRSMGYRKAYLWVFQENRNARQFYERFGFMRGVKTQTDLYDGKELKELMYIYHIE